MALGHPKGLFPLFFIEAWERLAFYTMLGILLLYTTDLERGGLGLPAVEGNQIYGMYLAFVYFTPFLGGILADRLLGYRLAVLIGGLLMALGLFAMGTMGYGPFIFGLVCLVVGNGLFKPNISVMVGQLYGPNDPRRDAGFNIFYVGINIGSLLAGLLAATVRNELGWLITFRVAGAGVLCGVLILLLHWKLLRRADRRPAADPQSRGLAGMLAKLFVPALACGALGFVLARAYLPPDAVMRPGVIGFLAGMVPVAVFFIRLGRDADPAEKPGLLALLPVYLAGATFFMVLHLNGSAMTQWARDNTDRRLDTLVSQDALPRYYRNAGPEVPRPDPRALVPVPSRALAQMFGQQRLDQQSVLRIAAIGELEVKRWDPHRSPNGLEPGERNWFERAVTVYQDGAVGIVDGSTDSPVRVTLQDGARPVARVAFLRAIDGQQVPVFVVSADAYRVLYDDYTQNYGGSPKTLPPGEFIKVVNPEIYQSFNGLFVLLFTPLVLIGFRFLTNRNRPVTTARKIVAGLLLTASALVLMVIAAVVSGNGAVKAGAGWLIGFYAIITVGELCLSPMSLSLVTKLSPKRLLGLTMGGWFLATALGNNFAGFFGGLQERIAPVSFFLILAGICAFVASILLFMLPRLDRIISRYEG